jgi:hypothetical protein
MKLTKTQLKEIIREELKNITSITESNIQDIAKKLKRTHNSINNRAKNLGLKRTIFIRKEEIDKENFYTKIKNHRIRETVVLNCCLCNYKKHIQLHHIDGNNENHQRSNIATLCPNHHVEVECGEHDNKKLYSIYWRICPDGTTSKVFNNYEETPRAKIYW